MTSLGSEALRPLRRLFDLPMPIDEVLRMGIRLGIIPGGAKLVQGSLASAFDVSRIPVREALRTLAAEGLVAMEEGRSARVIALSFEDVDELYSLRLQLEPELAEEIIRHATNRDQADLEGAARLMDELTDSKDRLGWSETNFRFHTSMYRIARRPHHVRFISQLLSLTEPYSRFFVFSLDGLRESQDEHHEMTRAIRDREIARLQSVITKHLERAREGILKYIMTQDVFEVADIPSDIQRMLSALTVDDVRTTKGMTE